MFTVEMTFDAFKNGPENGNELISTLANLDDYGIIAETLQPKLPEPFGTHASIYRLKVDCIGKIGVTKLLSLLDGEAILEFKFSQKRVPRLKTKARQALLKRDLDEVLTGVTLRTRNALRNDRIRTVAILITRTAYQLSRLPNVGDTGVMQVQEWLISKGLKPLELDGWQCAN